MSDDNYHICQVDGLYKVGQWVNREDGKGIILQTLNPNCYFYHLREVDEFMEFLKHKTKDISYEEVKEAIHKIKYGDLDK